MAKTSCKKGQYYCNTDKKCKPIPRGFTVREDGFLVREGWSAKYKKSIDCDNPKGFSQKAHCAGKKKKMTEESNPRIARKKGQPAKSKKHSDLYTDEDPKGTIHGLGFKDVATAKASVAKIRKSSRSHAHKIQAAIAMEQRARVMGKTAEAAVYRKFINSMKKKTKAMNEEKHGDHEYEMIRRQTDNIMVAAKKLKKKVGKGEGNAKAWVQSKITKAADYLDTAADYMTDKDNVKEGTLRSWFKGSKSKDGKGGWVNVKTGGTCASDEPGEGVPKCVSRAKYDSMSKKERESAHRRKREADPNQQSKTGAAKPTYVSTDKKSKKKKKMKEEFVSLPLQLEIPQNDGEFKLGLMFRESLEQDRGMLFIFENNDYHTFHMKNTFIPLDIAFIKEDGTIDSIEELDPMSPIPVSPRSEIRYAVEVNRGWFAENDVNVGDALLEEEELNEVKDKKGKGSGTKDACYYKVKSRYSVWPSAYASGALVKCRKVGAANWGNSKKEEVEYEYEVPTDSHYSWRNSLNEAPDSSMMKKPELHTRGGKTAPEPNSTQTAIKKVGQKLKDKFYEDTQINERTIAQKNSMQQRNKDAARARAQQMAKDRIAAKQKAAAPAPTPKPQPTQQAAPRPQVQKPVPKAAAPAPQRVAVPKPQTSVRTRGGGVQSAPKPSGLLSKIGSGIKRVAGGVADAATGNKFDFDKRGGQKPAPKIAGSGNVRGSGARANRAPQAAPQRVAQGQPAPLRGQQRQPQQGQAAPLRGQRQPQQGQAAGTVTRTGAQAAAAAEKVGGTQNIPASQKVTPTSSTSGPGRGSIKFSKGALTKLVGGGSGNTAQKPVATNNNQSGGGKTVNVGGKDVDLSKVGPGMRKILARKNVGTNAAKEVQKVNPKVGQTVTTKQDPNTGSVSSTVSGSPSKGVPTKDTKFATDKLLNKNRTDGKTYSAADAKRMEKSFNASQAAEPDFDEFDNVPVVNSKGKKVKKIPGTNAMPSGGSNKSVNANLDSF